MEVLMGMLIVTVIISACVYLLHRKFTYWSRCNINQLPVNLLFGNITNIALRRIPLYDLNKKVYTRCKSNDEKYIGYYIFTKPVLMVKDLELIKRILGSDFEHFTDRVFYINKTIDPLSDNLLGMKGSEWKNMRERLTAAYTPSKLKNLVPVLQSVGDQLKLALDKAASNLEVVNFQDLSSRYVVDAMVLSIFGIECNTLHNSNEEFEYHAKKVMGGSTIQNVKMIVSVLNPGLLDYFGIPFNSQEIQEFYINMTRQTVEYREKNNTIRKDLMDSLIQMRNNVDINNEGNNFQKSLTIEEIAAQIMAFFAAGYETSSTVLTFAVYELISNVAIQTKLRKEVTEVLKKYDDKLSYQALAEMTYMDMCLYETMRKYTVIDGILRVCTKQYKIPDEDSIIDVGSYIMIPIGQIHHDADYYPDPEKFDPERFSEEHKSKLKNFAFLGFGQGPRQCIGTRLAMLKMKLFLTILLNNYYFSLDGKISMPMKLHESNAVLKFKDDLNLHFEKI